MLYGMTNWEVTIAELMSEAGYATGMFGKWHIGDVPGRFPTDQGFDEWYGVANTTDESEYSSQFQYDPEVGTKPMIVDARKGEVPRDVKPYNIQSRREIDAELNKRAIDFIERNVKSNNPFLPLSLILNRTFPHCRIPISMEKPGMGIMLMFSQKLTTGPAKFWTQSTN
jgi:arylsulfatase